MRLKWEEAEVSEGRLKVGLEGDGGQRWKQSFQNTVRLLGANEWGEVSLNKGSVQVSQVPRGEEEKLRHYLEGVVEQANAAVEAAERRPKDSGDDAPDGPDAEMQERFRSFAEKEEDAQA